jgi:hypothetical protein
LASRKALANDDILSERDILARGIADGCSSHPTFEAAVDTFGTKHDGKVCIPLVFAESAGSRRAGTPVAFPDQTSSFVGGNEKGFNARV